MSRELTVTIRFTCNEGEAMRNALRFATRPSNTDEWAHSPRERRYAEAAMSKIMETMDRWERWERPPHAAPKRKTPRPVNSPRGLSKFKSGEASARDVDHSNQFGRVD